MLNTTYLSSYCYTYCKILACTGQYKIERKKRKKKKKKKKDRKREEEEKRSVRCWYEVRLLFVIHKGRGSLGMGCSLLIFFLIIII